jgi:hypothetical protein
MIEEIPRVMSGLIFQKMVDQRVNAQMRLPHLKLAGTDQRRAAAPASTHDPFTDAQIQAIIFDREIHGLSLTTQNLDDSI